MVFWPTRWAWGEYLGSQRDRVESVLTVYTADEKSCSTVLDLDHDLCSKVCSNIFHVAVSLAFTLLIDMASRFQTLQTISFLAHLRGKGVWGPFLIVAPLSTINNWVAEFERFVVEALPERGPPRVPN